MPMSLVERTINVYLHDRDHADDPWELHRALDAFLSPIYIALRNKGYNKDDLWRVESYKNRFGQYDEAVFFCLPVCVLYVIRDTKYLIHYDGDGLHFGDGFDDAVFLNACDNVACLLVV